MGVGNPDKADDGIGVYIAEKLIKKGFPDVYNCMEVPENYAVKACAEQPDNIIIIDAVCMDEQPGTVKVLCSDDLSGGISTHNAGLDMLCDFIKNESNANIYIIAIQPAAITGDMTPEVMDAGERVLEVMGGFLCKNHKKPKNLKDE